MKAIGLRTKSGLAIAAIVKKSADAFTIEAVRKVALSSVRRSWSAASLIPIPWVILACECTPSKASCSAKSSLKH